jgi:hypothetical protein
MMEMPNGKFLYPIAVDARGNPMQFERGVSYIVSQKGRWRKRRVTGASCGAPDFVADKPLVVETGDVERKAPQRHKVNVHDPVVRPVYRHWLKLSKVTRTTGAIMVDAWYDFDSFYHDVLREGPYQEYTVLRRIDAKKPFGPDNFRWLKLNSTEAGSSAKLRRLFTEMQIKHIRNAPMTELQLMNLYGVTRRTISQIRNGETYRDLQ